MWKVPRFQWALGLVLGLQLALATSFFPSKLSFAQPAPSDWPFDVKPVTVTDTDSGISGEVIFVPDSHPQAAQIMAAWQQRMKALGKGKPANPVYPPDSTPAKDAPTHIVKPKSASSMDEVDPTSQSLDEDDAVLSYRQTVSYRGSINTGCWYGGLGAATAQLNGTLYTNFRWGVWDQSTNPPTSGWYWYYPYPQLFSAGQVGTAWNTGHDPNIAPTTVELYTSGSAYWVSASCY